MNCNFIVETYHVVTKNNNIFIDKIKLSHLVRLYNKWEENIVMSKSILSQIQKIYEEVISVRIKM